MHGSSALGRWARAVRRDGCPPCPGGREFARPCTWLGAVGLEAPAAPAPHPPPPCVCRNIVLQVLPLRSRLQLTSPRRAGRCGRYLPHSWISPAYAGWSGRETSCHAAFQPVEDPTRWIHGQGGDAALPGGDDAGVPPDDTGQPAGLARNDCGDAVLPMLRGRRRNVGLRDLPVPHMFGRAMRRLRLHAGGLPPVRGGSGPIGGAGVSGRGRAVHAERRPALGAMSPGRSRGGAAVRSPHRRLGTPLPVPA